MKKLNPLLCFATLTIFGCGSNNNSHPLFYNNYENYFDYGIGHNQIKKGDAHSGNNVGYGRGDDDFEENLKLAGAEALCRPDAQQWGVDHAADRVDEHDEEGRVKDQKIFRGLADAKPDDGNRDHRRRRQETGRLNDRLEDVADDAQPTHQHAEDHSSQAPRHEADEDSLKTGQDVSGHLAGVEQRNRGGSDLRWRWEQVRIQQIGRGKLPGAKEQHHRAGQDHPARYRPGGPRSSGASTAWKRDFHDRAFAESRPW